jgi:glucosyl-3-phosphoglycerate synthase
MSDFAQNGLITTLHDLGTVKLHRLETLLNAATQKYGIGLVLPVTASDMRAPPFAHIVDQLCGANYVDTIVVVLGMAPEEQDYRDTDQIVSRLGDKCQILWTDSPNVTKLYDQLTEADLRLGAPGKGRAVWTAFGYLLADPRLKAFVLHDCDIVDYDRIILARLCLPMAHPSLDFEFCKAYYARCTDRMHGRVVRLLVSPMLRALISIMGDDLFLRYLDSYRYPLAGEFAVTSTLALSNRVPSDWGLEVGTLAEVFRNTSVKRVCQVDLCRLYEHKHQELSLEDPSKGLTKMATDILTTVFRTLASRGMVIQPGHFTTLRSAYLRSAQDAIRQYHADALMNGLYFDRHAEEQAVEGFARQIAAAGEVFQSDPAGGEAIPNWARVLAAFPDFPLRLREAAHLDAEQFATPPAAPAPP